MERMTSSDSREYDFVLSRIRWSYVNNQPFAMEGMGDCSYCRVLTKDSNSKKEILSKSQETVFLGNSSI